jgi:alkanesulfonate monooxygenase SsuD/methylene tetrahydromethanopterin reductase-like flavin-dependent oxidoreductase (luciferase family)
LIHPPEPVPPISLGVTGPKSLALSGQVADGTILSEYSSPAYVTWARETIAEGQREADLDRDHRLTVFAFACAAESTEAARRQLRPMVASALASRRMDAKLAPMGLLPQIRALREAGGQACLEAEMPDAWIDHLTLAGTPEDWNEAIGRLVDAGAETVVVVPMPDRGVDELDRFIRHLGL